MGSERASHTARGGASEPASQMGRSKPDGERASQLAWERVSKTARKGASERARQKDRE